MRMKRFELLVLIALAFCCLSGLPYKTSLAGQGELVFEKNAQYDIYYQVENHIQYIAGVKITDTVKIDNSTFLQIEPSTSPTAKSGYVAVSSVIAILPAGSPKPQTVPNVKE